MSKKSTEHERVAILARAIVNSKDYEALKKAVRSNCSAPAGVIPSTPHGAHVQLGWRECEAAFFETIERLADGDEVPAADAFGDPFPQKPSMLRFQQTDA